MIAIPDYCFPNDISIINGTTNTNQFPIFSFTLKTPETTEFNVQDDFLSCLCQQFTEVIIVGEKTFTI